MIKRYISNADYEIFRNSAQNFVNILDDSRKEYLYTKPYDRADGNKMYFINMYDALNLIETMGIKPNGKILEVGSGSGWITEILASLNFKVYALEPCNDFINIAKEKIGTLGKDIHCDINNNVEFFNNTLEDCDFEDNSFDAIIFFASFHHIVDEVNGLKKCFQYLKSGGVIGIADEEFFNPDKPEQMTGYKKETQETGVLESPFAKEYLMYLFNQQGFINTTTFTSINGLFSSEQQDFEDYFKLNKYSLIAHKPYNHKTTLDEGNFITSFEINILNKEITNNIIEIKMKLKNAGETIWLHNANLKKGFVTIALYNGNIGSSNFSESFNRINLPRDVYPDETIDIDAIFQVPYTDRKYDIDLINEGVFWFSQK